MNVLFVCRANLGRSQIASVIFDSLSQHRSQSAGTIVAAMGGEGLTVLQRVQEHPQENAALPLIIDVMDQEGLGISSGVRTQLTPEMVDSADRVIVMAQRDSWPEYLVEGSKVVFWEIEDPFKVTMDTVRSIKDQIKTKIEELVQETG